MKTRVLFSLLLAVVTVPCWAAISHSGSCSAASTSCTFSGTATGDLKIVFAYRTGSTTAPGLPTGWTSIAVANEASGTTGAIRIGCNKSSSGADTGSGTWTNATVVAGVSYSGTWVDTTADCNTTGIGAIAGNKAATSTALNYPAIGATGGFGSTSMVASNKSWVAGFAGDSAGGICAPTGMTQQTTAGAGPAVIASDTNGSVASWASTNCTITSGTWISEVVEILPACPTGFCQMICAGNTGISSGSVTLKRQVQVNDTIAAVMFWASTSVTLNSISDTQNGNYHLLDNPTLAPVGFTASTAQAYVVSIVNASLTLTFTLSGTVSGNSQICVAEIAGMSPSNAIDGHGINGQSGPGTGANAVTSPTIITTVNGDVIMGWGYDLNSNDSFTAGTGFTLRNTSSPTLEDLTQGSAGSIAATLTISGGDGTMAGIMAFHPTVTSACSNFLAMMGAGCR
jgi:hypothetical protein